MSAKAVPVALWNSPMRALAGELMIAGKAGYLRGGRAARLARLRRLETLDRFHRRIWGNAPLVEARVLPELAGDLERIDLGRLPPRLLVTGALHLTVVHAAERHRELIARLPTERTRLGKSKMMRIRWLTAANQARHLDDRPQVLTVSVAARCRNRQHAFVYRRC